jgi:anti-sigma B factor antagonist
MSDFFSAIDQPIGLTVTVTERSHGVQVLTLVGEIDAATVDIFDHALAGGDRLVADLTRVTFLSCAGVRSLLRTHERAELAVVVGGHAVARSLEATGADLELVVHPRTEDALAALAGDLAGDTVPEAGDA